MKNKFVSMIIAVFCIAFACLADIVISPTSIDYAVGGGGAAIRTSGSGTWTATTDVSWITIVKSSGDAGVACTYIVSKNNGADMRTGHITIAGNVYTVTQKGCPVMLTPNVVNVDKTGVSGVVTASMDAGVDWTADVSDSWITISPLTGSGASEISYTVAPYNEVGSRIGTIRIGSEKVTINQTGIDVTLTPASTNIVKDVCVVPLQVVAMTETKWSVTPNVPWISVLDGGNGFGGSQVTIAVAENPSFQQRTGTVSIGSATFTVIQSGTDDVNFKILPEVATASPKGAFANVAVYATPDASWTAESLDSWIKIADGAEGKGNGNVKYVTMSNPELEPRTGHIKFTPPVYEPELDLYSGLLFWIKEQDNIEGNELRQTTYPLSKVFDGSFSNPLKGTPIPTSESHAYTFSFSFKLGSIDCLNRIMMIGNHSIYIAEDNMLYYHGLKTDLVIDETGEFYTVVVCVDEEHNLKLYAGLKDDELVCVYSGLISGCLTFDSSLEMSKFTLGYATYPSTGFMQSGQFANIRFWLRELTDKECKYVDLKQNEILERGSSGVPGNVKYDFFSLNGNAYSVDESSDAPRQSDVMSISGWQFTQNRSRQSCRALKSDGTGTIVIDKIHKLFEGDYVLNQGQELYVPMSEYDDRVRHYMITKNWTWPNGARMVSAYPYGATSKQGSDVDATYVLWMKIDSLPTVEVPVLNRTCKNWKTLTHSNQPSNQAFDIEEAYNNRLLTLSLMPSGQLKIFGSGVDVMETSSVRLVANKWHMVSIVGKSKSSIIIFVDGVEVGSVSSIMTLGYLPPLDLRFVQYNEKYGGDYCTPHGSVVDSEYTLTIGGWKGDIDELIFYNKALTTKEIKNIYEAGLPAQDVLHTVNQGIQEPTITPSVINVGKFGCSTNIDFEVARAINWTVQPNEPWLNVVGATSGTGPATITVKVVANTDCAPRTGTVTIGNKTLTVNQEALYCVVEAEKTVFPTEADETGGMGFITVSPEGNGSWTATSDVDWIYCFPESGTGSSDVYFFVEDMGSTAASRSGTITIGGQTIEITQRGYDLSIEPCVAEVGGNAGAGVIGVAADADAVWTAIADVPWITIISAANGYVRYTFTDNTTGETRVGHINISGEEYTLTQTCKLDLNTTIVGQGTVTGGGKYAQGAVVTLRATPASGYEFSHWSGDMVGTEANGTVRMDTVKNVTATFIPEAAAQVLAEKKAAQGGFYTRDQIHALEVGNLVLDVDSASGTARVGVQLMETSDLSNPNSWKPVSMTQGNLDVGNDGTVGLNVKASGNAKFFKVVVPKK